MSIAPKRAHVRPKVIGHISGNLDMMAIRIRERMRNYGPMVLWIEGDGCVVGMPEGIGAPPSVSLIGVYDYAGSTATDLAEDIGCAAKEFGQACVMAREGS